MKRNKRFGFTLVELLAVIVIIGLLMIIAVPKVINTLNNSKKRTFELTAKSIIKAAEEKYLENEAYGLEEKITCESVSNITSNDFSSSVIEFDNLGNGSVTIVGKGRYKGLYICNGTKTDAKVETEQCSSIGNEDNNSDNSGENNDGDSSDVTLPSDTTIPVITIDQELGISSDSPLIIGSSSYTVSGTVTDESGIDSLTVNDTNVTVSENGVWSTTLTLTQSVVTEVNIVAKDSNGNTSDKTVFVKYGVESGYAYYNGVLLPVDPYSYTLLGESLIYYSDGVYYYLYCDWNGLRVFEVVNNETEILADYSFDLWTLNSSGTGWTNKVYYSINSDFRIPVGDFVWSTMTVKEYMGDFTLAVGSEPVPVYK